MMRTVWILTGVLCFCFLVLITACQKKETPTTTRETAGREAALAKLSQKARDAFRGASLTPFGDVPIPPDNPLTQEKVELGKLLFFDPRLSGDGRTSCATCHIPEKAWADGKAVCVGAGGRKCLRNTPTLLNVGYYQKLFWDGRSNSLEDQALKHLAGPEMGSSPDQAAKRISAVSGYQPLFRAAFGSEGITPERIAKALAAFERTIVTRDSPFDRFFQGELNALSETQLRGLELFLTRGNCTKCHRGRFFTIQDLMPTTLFMDPDYGLYNITKKEYDKGRFKVPTLRNVALTAPYNHNGYEATLEDMVFFTMIGHSRRVMREKGQKLLAQVFTNEEIKSVVEFLNSLTGELPTIERPGQLPQ